MNRSIAAAIGAVAAVSFVAIGAALLGTPQEGEASTAFDARFVGNWDLVSYVSFRESGETVDNNYSGRIIYDALGNMTGIGMPRDLPERPREDDGSLARAGFAYWSTTTVHADDGYIVHHVVGSPMMPNWVGSHQIRYFEFDEGGDILRLSLRDDDEPTGRITGTLTWRKIE